MEEAILQLIELVKTASIELWQIGLRQAYVKGMQSLVWTVVFLFVAQLFGRWALQIYHGYKNYTPESHHNPDELLGTLLVTVVIGLGFSLGGLYMLQEAVGLLYNPRFYALQMLIDLAGGLR